MSKKNLSLLMDGFMGEAIPSDPVQEQPEEQAVEQDAEQAEQPAAQTDKQDSPLHHCFSGRIQRWSDRKAASRLWRYSHGFSSESPSLRTVFIPWKSLTCSTSGY